MSAETPKRSLALCSYNDSNAVYYYHFDGLGSVVALSDADGDTVQVYEYDVYGQVAASDPNHTNPFLFTGRRFDSETGLYYYRARYYNPYIGRFLQTDPIGYEAGMNLYRYCHNSPLSWVDWFGREPKFIFDGWSEVGRPMGHWVRPSGFPKLPAWDYDPVENPHWFKHTGPYVGQTRNMECTGLAVANVWLTTDNAAPVAGARNDWDMKLRAWDAIEAAGNGMPDALQTGAKLAFVQQALMQNRQPGECWYLTQGRPTASLIIEAINYSGLPAVIGIDLNRGIGDPAWHAITIIRTPASLVQYLVGERGYKEEEVAYSVLDPLATDVPIWMSEDRLQDYLDFYGGEDYDGIDDWWVKPTQ